MADERLIYQGAVDTIGGALFLNCCCAVSAAML